MIRVRLSRVKCANFGASKHLQKIPITFPSPYFFSLFLTLFTQSSHAHIQSHSLILKSAPLHCESAASSCQLSSHWLVRGLVCSKARSRKAVSCSGEKANKKEEKAQLCCTHKEASLSIQQQENSYNIGQYYSTSVAIDLIILSL